MEDLNFEQFTKEDLIRYIESNVILERMRQDAVRELHFIHWNFLCASEEKEREAYLKENDEMVAIAKKAVDLVTKVNAETDIIKKCMWIAKLSNAHKKLHDAEKEATELFGVETPADRYYAKHLKRGGA